MERLDGRIVHYVYVPRWGFWRLVGRIVYDESQPAPIKGERRVNALYLGETFTDQEEFRLRLEAVKKAGL